MQKWEMLVYQGVTAIGQGYNAVQDQRLVAYLHPSDEEVPPPEYADTSETLAAGWEPLGVSCYVGPGNIGPVLFWVTSFRRPPKEEDDD
jgi:hypothetical protein